MEPISASLVAGTVTSWMAKGFEKFADGMGSAAWDRASSALASLRGWLSGRPRMGDVLEAVARTPTEERAIANLKAQIEEEMRADPVFAKKLTQIVDETSAHQGITNHFYDAVKNAVTVEVNHGNINFS